MSPSAHHRDLKRFYEVFEELEDRIGRRTLKDCHGRQNWSRGGVYFFFEPGEIRPDGATPRVVRVGAHAVSAGAKTTLWNRLSTHRGAHPGTAIIEAHLSAVGGSRAPDTSYSPVHSGSRNTLAASGRAASANASSSSSRSRSTSRSTGLSRDLFSRSIKS